MFPRMLLITALALSVGGCNTFLAQRMVVPPNGGRTPAAIAQEKPDANELHIPMGPPKAVIYAWVLEPKTPAKATIILLHGFIATHSQMNGEAKALCKAGYRTVQLDLRGHGKSTGDFITYGVNDARDLAQVTSYLQAHNLCGDSVGVYGASYGAASAILFAGSDPRVKAVFAIAPSESLRAEAPYFGRHLLPLPGLFMSKDDFTSIVNQMGQFAGFDPDACSPLAAIRKTSAHVRLIAGANDMIVSTQSSLDLAAAAPDRTELTIVPGKGHLDLCLDNFGTLHPQTQAWFDKYLAPKTATAN